MFVNLEYDPEEKVYHYPGVEKAIEDIREMKGDKEAEFFANLKWGQVLEKKADGVYEFWDVNDPMFDNLRFKSCEYVPLELAKELHYEFLDWCLKRGDTEKFYMSYPYGVCDKWEQIFEKIPEIKYYKESKEEFVIFLCEHRRNSQPEDGGWRWHKWGPYIGDKEPQYEYLYDEPEIESIYTFHVSRVVKKNEKDKDKA